MEQFKKRVEKLLSDSIPLWRLLKLLFKILKWRSWMGYPCFDFFLRLFIQFFWFSLLHPFLLFSGSLSRWRATKTTPHSSSRRNTKPTQVVKRNTPVSPTLCFRYQSPVRRRKDVKLNASCLNFNANWKNSNWKQKATQKNQTSQKFFVEVNLERSIKNASFNPRNFRVRFLIVGNCGSNTINL